VGVKEVVERALEYSFYVTIGTGIYHLFEKGIKWYMKRAVEEARQKEKEEMEKSYREKEVYKKLDEVTELLKRLEERKNGNTSSNAS
jgi:hypothetical protein